MRFLLVLVFFISFISAQAQKDTIVKYWNGNVETNVVEIATTRAVYIRKSNLWHMESRYLSNNNIYMTASYKDADVSIRHGDFKWYHENGVMLSKVKYFNNKEEGPCLRWHENGQLQDSTNYRTGRLVNKGFSWDENGAITHVYELDNEGNGHLKIYRSKDSLDSEGPYLEGQKSGTWVYYSSNGMKEWEVDYQKDSILTAICFDESGKKIDDCIFERMAIPPGGHSGWMQYLSRVISKVNYPSDRLLKKTTNVSGNVHVRFLVERDGSLTDIQIVQSLNSEADAIVLKAMKKSPKWTPGIYKNKPVRSYHTQPITFQVVL